MQVLTRELINNNNWVLLLLVLGLIFLVILKTLNSSRLIGYSLAFFKKGFMEKRVETKPHFFSPFHFVLFSFCTLNLTLFFYAVDLHFKFLHFRFLTLLGIVTIYLVIRYGIDYFMSNLFSVFNLVKYFIHTKFGYLYSLSIWLFPFLILYFFSFKNIYFLTGFFLILFLTRFFLIVYNNKKLIVSNLFYFFIYLCALEIAPLFILYPLLIK